MHHRLLPDMRWLLMVVGWCSKTTVMFGELNNEQIEQVLLANVVGRIGCYADGKVYVVPVTYVYENGVVIGHTGEGLKVSMLRKNPECCFEIDAMQNMANWQSVIAWGTFEELHNDEAAAAMTKLIGRLMPLMASETSQPTHGLEQTHHKDTRLVKAVVYRIRLKEKTGRFEKR